MVKLILFIPVLLASLLLISSPATAGVIEPANVQHVELVSGHPQNVTVAPRFSEKSNPITDAMGCSCSACVKAKLQLEGKLPISSLL